MRPKMMSKQSMDHLFDHILDGFKGSYEGIELLQKQGLVSDEEIQELLKKNSKRLIDRIKEFRAMEKLTCVFFALLFGYMQITCEDLDMRRARRVRPGRKKHEQELTM